MTATFHIEYYTQPGERLLFVWHYAEDASSVPQPQQFSHPMREVSPGHWQVSLPLADKDGPLPLYIYYHYEVYREQGTPALRPEWGSPRRCRIEDADYYDAWLDSPSEAPLYSQAFSRVPSKTFVPSDLTFSVQAPDYGTDSELALVGSAPELGAWDPEQALPLQPIADGRYAISLSTEGWTAETFAHLTYKYIVKTGGEILWEEGADRSFRSFPIDAGRKIYQQDAFLRLPAPQIRRAGVAFPLFALRSDKDWGIGDFDTLREEALPFAKAHDLQAIQLLPINDTTFTRGIKDSYPYNAISVDALHPIYIAIDQLPRLQDKKREQALRRRAKKLRGLPTVDFPAVLALKEEYLQTLFAEQGEALTSTADFQHFLTTEAWLAPYACYCVLRDRHPQVAPQAWDEGERYDETILDALQQDPETAHRYHYYCWVQYTLDSQLRAVAEACTQQGLFLKGDLPIGVAPHSVDIWTHPELFHSAQSAGAPPDAFADDGQNWGFPTYNWRRMELDDYAWWKERLQHQARYFSALRIDHVLGFFRIWEIPRPQRSGLAGHFHPALPYTLEEWQALLGDSIEVQTLAEPEDGSSPEGLPEGSYPLLRDPYQKERFHPRIAWEKTDSFQSWSEDLRARWRAASEDYFYQRHNALYRETGLVRLRALTQATRLLLCAEDLGMIPASVPEVLDTLQILTLDLERMPKGFTLTGWANPLLFPTRSVATTSTHDMPSLRGWWHSLPAEEQERYQREELGLSQAVSEEDVYRLILQSHLQSPSMLAILPLADWMSSDQRLWLTSPEAEQINHPEDPDQYWRFRFPCTLSAIAALAPDWQKTIQAFIHQANRTPFARL